MKTENRRKIILASRSKARRQLLKQIGLRFKVMSSRVSESRKIRTNCSGLVVDNAVRKAKDVASRLKSGIVIGADTVALVNNKIIGKPKNKKEALMTLRLLSRSPQWIYSGIAVIDVDKDKIYTDWEKTRVYMYKLSDAQILDYFKRVSPHDKAGSFDIEGLGSVFVRRIEGCFYNVVGLPLAKLARILEKTGVDVI